MALAYVLSAIPALRCDWHLVVGSNRMGIGRYCGIDVLQNNKKETNVKCKMRALLPCHWSTYLY